ncbi:MAG: glycerol-3-phosphate acyltransferase [Clostridium sp.]|nr:glycerol-3-phosphate acyltransferase [Clostridium sp.]
MLIILICLVCFLIGAIPNGYILAKKLYNIDIRTQGSGNIGSTNMRRILNNKVSVLTQVLDILKGLIPTVVVAMYLMSTTAYSDETKSLILCAAALCTVLGHDYTPFLGFNGGKGVNTTLGAFFLLSPFSVIIGVLLYFVLKPVTEIVFLRSIALGASLVITSFMFVPNTYVIGLSFVLFLLLLIRHKKNFRDYFREKKNK